MRSPEEDELIEGGVSLTDLGDMFGLTPQEVKKKLTGNVKPWPNSKGLLRYRVRDAAPYLCEMRVDHEDLIDRLMKLPTAKWPPALQDAFWKAQNSRQVYEEKRGDLWRTSRVYEVVAAAFKTIRMTIIMFADTVEQRTELTPHQRKIIQELGDGLLTMLSDALREAFAGYVAKEDEHGAPVHDKTPVLTGDDEEEDGAALDPWS